MDHEETRNRLRIQKNECFLRENVDISSVLPQLFQEKIITQDDKERIEWERTTGDKISTLLSIIKDIPKSYEVFLRSVDSFVKEKLEKTEISEEDVKIEHQNCDDFVREKVRLMFREDKDESIFFSTLEDDIRQAFLNVGKQYRIEHKHLQELVIGCFNTVEVKRSKKRRVKFQNLTRKTQESDSDSDNGAGGKDTSMQICSIEKPEERIRMINMSEDELCSMLEQKLNEFKLDCEILKIIKDKEIKGVLFMKIDHKDSEYLFPDFSPGKRVTLLKIRDALLEEENDSVSDTQPTMAYQKEVESVKQPHFRETFRKFDTPTQPLDTYKKYALLQTSVSRPHNLIHPIHLFLGERQKSQLTDIHEWIATETVKFADACMNSRTNGTIHFGVQRKEGTGDTEGEIVGLNIDKYRCKQAFKKEVRDCFFKDQIEMTLKCIRPMEFIDVAMSCEEKTTSNLLVVEVDVVPHSVILKDEAVFVQENDSNEDASKLTLYAFGDDDPYPRRLNHDETLTYMNNKTKLAEHRLQQEKMQIDVPMDSNLRQKFLNLFSSGEEVLSSEAYPILFLTPLSSHMDEQYAEMNLQFIKYIDSSAVFDFDCCSKGKGMYHFMDVQQNQVVKVLTIENFDRTSEENKEHPERFTNLVADLDESSLKPWIFCNGYDVMNIAPMTTFDWKQNRSVGFKEALRFYKQSIPEGRAMVIFILFSKSYEAMLEAAEEVVTTFKDQWMLLAENEDIANSWMCELQRRNTVDKKMNNERCIVGMPWHHVNIMIQQVTKAVKISTCELPTSTGASCVLHAKDKTKLCDLDILSRKECDNSEILKDKEALKKCQMEVQEHFYHGGQVSWWNFWFGDDVLERAKHKILLTLVIETLEGKRFEEDNRVGVVDLMHQPGAGGTTSARHVLWELRTKYRCCVVKTITDETCDQIIKLRSHDDPKTPLPPLVLLDNFDEESVHRLYVHLEHRARQAAQRSESPIKTFCVLLLCVRRTKLPTQVKANSVHLKHALDGRELQWFNNMYETLEKRFKNTGCTNPKLLISFNILKENFNQNYIKNAAKEYVDAIELEKEKKLLTYLALMNTYDIEFQPVPISTFDTLMTNMSDKKEDGHTMTYGLCVPHRRISVKPWEKNMSHALQILLNISPSAGLGNNGLKSLSIINALFAEKIFEYLQSVMKMSKSDILLEFLDSSVFKSQNRSVEQTTRIVKDILKKRVEIDHGKKEKFSPLVSKILEQEDSDKAAAVMDKAFQMTKDPMIAQQIARLYIHSQNWDKAIMYAQLATDMKPQNSYLWDTYGQIFKSQLFEKYEKCVKNGENVIIEEMTSLIDIAMEGLEKFHREQKESEKESQSPNNLGYVSEVKIVVVLLDLIGFSQISKANLHKFLVNKDFTHQSFATLSLETRENLRKFQGYAETAMRKIEEKSSQLKDSFTNTTFRGTSGFLRADVLSYLRENVDHYFGENDDKAPKGLGPSETADFFRRRIRRIGGRTLSNVLSLRRDSEGKQKLEAMYDILHQNINSQFCNDYDLKTLISVAIAMQTAGCKSQISHQDILNLSQRLYDIGRDPKEATYPYLETYLFLLMLHWPTESKKRLTVCPLGKLQDAMKKLKIAFQKNHPRQLDVGNPFRKRETTYFFLGKESTCFEIVYYEELHDRHGSIYLKGDTIWQQPEVIGKLKRLEGVLVNEGSEVTIEVETAGGNKSYLTVPTSMPIGQRSLWQKKVYLFLGFSWSGPKAFDVSDESYQEQEEVSLCSPRTTDIKRLVNKNKFGYSSDINDQNKIRKIHERLKKIEKLKRRQDRNDSEEEELRQESQLRKKLDKIVQQRQQYLGT